ncbi:hypothetical protein E3226_006145 [Legionella geestiana]|uniref:alginate lyase family protein n=1 Tax=Legionella geestiana TaxID=45065 RepID=UPI001091CD55|nr:alginate lyase family protein [Legionella geestiana]QDQ40007.1 hypothetical protein E3226_006145 [Legionella geestiana]
MKKIKLARALVTSLGLHWTLKRAAYALKVRLGILRLLMPQKQWPVTDGQHDKSRAFLLQVPPQAFSASAEDFLQITSEDSPVIAAAEAILSGRPALFSHMEVNTGSPPAWHVNPLNPSLEYPRNHWSQIPDFALGDIKLVWEVGRFGFAFTLVRAYSRTGDIRYAEGFWQWFDDWFQQNPPNCGVHWKCGQEISLRVMACAFALLSLREAKVTTPDRLLRMSHFMEASAIRIRANVEYAINQKNNHGISEGMGLWTAAVMFPRLRGAAAWRRHGMRILKKAAQALIYNDGSFSQHSTNYHRVMLHDYLWVLALARWLGQTVDITLLEQLKRATNWLFQLYDPESGQLPNVGANDGALILPLTDCDYTDYRPLLQSLSFALYGIRTFEKGPWDEELLWLFGREASDAPLAPVTPETFSADDGGYYTLRGDRTWALIRCSRYRHRPSHADQLHIDVWWNGINIVLGPGTYSYNAPNPQHQNHSATCCHNTVTVDNLNQMDKVGRFFWAPWSQGQVLAFRELPRIQYWEGMHNGYERLSNPVTHRRAVLCLDGHYWLILDSLLAKKMHTYTVHFLLRDFPYEWHGASGSLRLDVKGSSYYVEGGATLPAEYALVRASEQSVEGWHSRYYFSREPALSRKATVHADNVLFWTLLGPSAMEANLVDNQLRVKTSTFEAEIILNQCAGTLIVDAVIL